MKPRILRIAIRLALLASLSIAGCLRPPEPSCAAPKAPLEETISESPVESFDLILDNEPDAAPPSSASENPPVVQELESASEPQPTFDPYPFQTENPVVCDKRILSKIPKAGPLPAFKRNQGAAKLLREATAKCPDLESILEDAAAFGADDEAEGNSGSMRLYVLLRRNLLEWWEYSIGNGIDGENETIYVELNLDTCKIRRAQSNDSFQYPDSEVRFAAKDDNPISEKEKSRLIYRVDLPMKLSYRAPVSCDPQFASQPLKAASYGSDARGELVSLTEKTRFYVTPARYPVQPSYPGLPMGGPPTVFKGSVKVPMKEKPLDNAATKEDPSADDEPIAPADYHLTGRTDPPTKVFSEGDIQLYQSPVRIRQHGTLIAVYHRASNRHQWAGWVDGAVKWYAASGRLAFGISHIEHPAFLEFQQIVVLDTKKGLIYQLSVSIDGVDLEESIPQSMTIKDDIATVKDVREETVQFSITALRHLIAAE